MDRSNLDEFLAWDKIAAIGGSFFVKEALEKMEEKLKNILDCEKLSISLQYQRNSSVCVQSSCEVTR